MRTPAAFTVAMVMLLAAPGARGQEPSAENVAEGMRIYRTKADCQACHGWAGDGRKMDTQMPDGANLRATRLGRAAHHRRDQVRPARARDAGVRSPRLLGRPLQRH